MRRTDSPIILGGALAVLAGCQAPSGSMMPTATPPAPETHLASTTRVPSRLPTSAPTTSPAPTPAPAPTSTDLSACQTLPQGGFLAIWQSDPRLQTALGCPTSNHPRIAPEAWEVNTSYQPFEGGFMIWSSQIGWYPQPVIYVVYEDATYQRFDDTFDPTVDPSGGTETAPAGLVEPVLGFGKVWRGESGVRERLGWGTETESAGSGRFQLFAGGDMIWLSQTDRSYVFVFSTAQARVFPVRFSSDP